MNISVYQRSGIGRRALSREVIKDFVRLFFDDASTEMLKYIEVNIVKVVDRSSKITMANCTNEGDGSFVIRIRSTLDEDDFKATMVHEMTHALQYCQKRLTSESGSFVWNSNSYESYDTDSEYEQYRNLPWEVEARKYEDLYMQICKGR